MITPQIPSKFFFLAPQNGSENVYDSPRRIFGPVSYFPNLRLLSRLPQPRPMSPTGKEARKKVVDDSHKFLLRKTEIHPELDEHSRENIEKERADRAQFVLMTMLATIQDEVETFSRP